MALSVEQETINIMVAGSTPLCTLIDMGHLSTQRRNRNLTYGKGWQPCLSLYLHDECNTPHAQGVEWCENVSSSTNVWARLTWNMIITINFYMVNNWIFILWNSNLVQVSWIMHIQRVKLIWVVCISNLLSRFGRKLLRNGYNCISADFALFTLAGGFEWKSSREGTCLELWAVLKARQIVLFFRLPTYICHGNCRFQNVFNVYDPTVDSGSWW